MLALHLSMWEVIIGLALFKQTSLYRKMVSLTFMTLVNAALIYNATRIKHRMNCTYGFMSTVALGRI